MDPLLHYFSQQAVSLFWCCLLELVSLEERNVPDDFKFPDSTKDGHQRWYPFPGVMCTVTKDPKAYAVVYISEPGPPVVLTMDTGACTLRFFDVFGTEMEVPITMENKTELIEFYSNAVRFQWDDLNKRRTVLWSVKSWTSAWKGWSGTIEIGYRTRKLTLKFAASAAGIYDENKNLVRSLASFGSVQKFISFMNSNFGEENMKETACDAMLLLAAGV